MLTALRQPWERYDENKDNQVTIYNYQDTENDMCTALCLLMKDQIPKWGVFAINSLPFQRFCTKMKVTCLQNILEWEECNG